MRTRYLSIPILLSVLLLAGCEPEFDEPPVDKIEKGDKVTVKELKDMYDGDPIHFEEDKNLYGVITMDERSGNLYQSVYMKDHTGAINLSLQFSGGLYEGDSIRVNLNGTVLTDYNNLVQLDSIDPDTNVVKQATDVPLNPEPVSLGQLDSSYQSKLVKIRDVEFHPDHQGVEFADADNQQALNRTVISCRGNSMIMRTSGYADFADQKTPSGNGSMVAIVGQFQETMQLLIRRPSELQMDGENCMVHLKDFNDQSLTSGGWTTKNVNGAQTWSVNDKASDSYYAQITGFDGNNSNANEDWLISPPFDASQGAHKLFFRNAKNYSGPDLELMVSEDYDGSSAPSTATWSAHNFKRSTGGFEWVKAGPIDLSSYSSSETYFAFKYTSNSNDAATWEVDDIFLSNR
jgi:hypothetical protein